MVQMSTMTKAAFVLFAFGFLFFLIGFCAPYWHHNKRDSPREKISVNYGLWRYCVERREYGRHPYDFCVNTITTTYGVDYLRATQFFETVGFLAALTGLVLLILQVCIASCKDRRILPILSAIFTIIAAGCIILGVIIFGAQKYEQYFLSWAFALTIVGGLIFAAVGVLIFVAVFVLKRTT